MLSPDILLKNQLIFIDPALKICTLDGKRLITRMITSLIKNKNLLKIYLFEFNIRKRLSGPPNTCNYYQVLKNTVHKVDFKKLIISIQYNFLPKCHNSKQSV